MKNLKYNCGAPLKNFGAVIEANYHSIPLKEDSFMLYNEKNHYRINSAEFQKLQNNNCDREDEFIQKMISLQFIA